MPEWMTESALLTAGGWILTIIVALSLLMWVLILERYWFIHRSRDSLEAFEARWREQRCGLRLFDRRLRAALLQSFRARLRRGVGIVQVTTAILPMLGLLGTVIGMITIFEVLTVFGTGNVRGLAGGISQALVTTMAGLLTALSGMYFAHDLDRRVEAATDRLARGLV